MSTSQAVTILSVCALASVGCATTVRPAFDGAIASDTAMREDSPAASPTDVTAEPVGVRDAAIDSRESHPAQSMAATALAPNGPCIVLEDRSARCWGRNRYGELGDGTRTFAATPRRVETPLPLVRIDLESTASVALTAAGTVLCAGIARVCGNPDDYANYDSPTLVSGFDEAVDVATACEHTCALRRDGTVTCAGVNDRGQVARGRGCLNCPPALVPGIRDAVQLAVGCDENCVVRRDGHVLCWGANGRWRILNAVLSDAVVWDMTLDDAIAVDVGLGGACAVRHDGTVVCFGSSARGIQMLDTLPGGSPPEVPTPVPRLSGVVGVRVSRSFACAIFADGGVACWGDNAWGNLGDGSTVAHYDPVRVVGLDHVVEVGVTYVNGFARTNDGRVFAWGGHERLGDGSATDRSVPGEVFW